MDVVSLKKFLVAYNFYSFGYIIVCRNLILLFVDMELYLQYIYNGDLKRFFDFLFIRIILFCRYIFWNILCF